MKTKRVRADLAEEEKQEREIKKQIEKAGKLFPVNNDSVESGDVDCRTSKNPARQSAGDLCLVVAFA